MRTSLVAVALCLPAILAFDWFVPSGYNVPLLYIGLLLLTMDHAVRPQVTWVVAALATALTLALALKTGDLQSGLFNRALSIVLLWVAAAGITARKRVERSLREQESLAQLGRMAAVVAHEVRNPLAGIKGALHIFERRFSLDASEQSVIKEVLTRIGHLASMVDDLLAFAQPTSPAARSISLDEVVSSTLARLGDDPLLAGIDIAVDVRRSIVRADPEQLRMVLTNLLVNSAQAMGGRGEVRISTHANGDWHELRVTDTGPGIPEEIRARLFDPFFTTKSRGTGLGLAIARRIVSAHGGTIEVLGPASGGATVVVKLPAEPSRQ